MNVFRSISYALTGALTFAAAATAQTAAPATAQTRAQVIAASFNKFKNVSKERRGVRKEKYLDVKSVPAVRANPSAYSGNYEVRDLGFSLQLTVAADGRVEGSGTDMVDPESGVRRSFRLANARVDQALLTATKVFADGRQERFEGVFINRRTSTSPTDGGVTNFGLGVIVKPFYMHGVTFQRLFYEPEPGATQ